jgi:hypothetical protein
MAMLYFALATALGQDAQGSTGSVSDNAWALLLLGIVLTIIGVFRRPFSKGRAVLNVKLRVITKRLRKGSRRKD